jgi:cyclopropane fatty-acyl-phospholipid synthase-like methyltransferase
MDDIFLDIHRCMPRQGPGNNDLTRRALTLAGTLPPKAAILDIGCGPGMQSLCLAEEMPDSRIFALDNHEVFLKELEQKIHEQKLGNRVQTINASMLAPPFEKEHFDILWSEGAIYIMGFENGLRLWNPLLKPEGILAVSELSWIRHERPAEISAYWEEQYPGMQHISGNIAVIEKTGYRLCGLFVFPVEAWYTHYYNPLLKRLDELKNRYIGIADFDTVVQMEKTEIAMLKQYSDYYNYVFYIMRKN